MTQQQNTDAVLTPWSAELAEALDVDLAVDVAQVLALAADAAHTVIRPAAPVTTFVVGYAAGLAAASGVAPETAVREATDAARRLLRERTD